MLLNFTGLNLSLRIIKILIPENGQEDARRFLAAEIVDY